MKKKLSRHLPADARQWFTTIGAVLTLFGGGEGLNHVHELWKAHRDDSIRIDKLERRVEDLESRR